jgi:predicted anti-sigma-YlaC factor YlaD
VTCAQCREAASARLDGEPIGASALSLDAHLASCVDCARWWDAAVALSRQLRVGSVEVPDLTEQILANVPMPRARRTWPDVTARTILALTGAVQMVVALPGLFGSSIDIRMGEHAAHESAAWNLALGIAFLSVTFAPKRVIGLLPMLTAFVAVLLTLSIADVISGDVAVGRLGTHTGIVIGLLAAWVLRLRDRRTPEAPRGRGQRLDEFDGSIDLNDDPYLRDDDGPDSGLRGSGMRVA